MKNQTKSYIYGFLCILFWALIPTISKFMLKELDNLQILFYSTIFSVITLFLIVLSQNKISLFKKYNFKDYSLMFLLGFLGSYLYYVLLYAAFNLTTASEGFILAYTWPILAIILGIWILKEKLTFVKIFAVILSFIGAAIVFTKGDILNFAFTNINGNLLALVSAFVFAFFSVIGKKANFDRTISAFIYWLAALILITITMPLFSSFKTFSMTTLLFVLLNGIVVNGITYIFWFKALELGDTAKISNLLYLSPFLALVYIFIFLKEQILLSSVIGLVFIVGGIVIQSLRKA